MMRARALSLAILVVCLLAIAPSAHAASTDAAVPGVPLPPSIVSDSLDASTDTRDVYSVTLVAGETLHLSLATDPAAATLDCDLDMYLYGPGAASGVPDRATAIAKAVLPLYYPESISYTAPASGTYYVELYAAEGAGPTRLTWSIAPEPLLPVFRFYNMKNGSHFFTPSADEAEIVKASYPTVYRYEGIAYYTKATKNSQPLYRFYNKKSGSHFYTASMQERDTVIATWPTVFTYEGESYKVSLTADGGKTPVYRFYNVRNGSHFFTASAEEANTVMARWPAIYSYEGPAFYLGQ